jgi:hypothetical protein
MRGMEMLFELFIATMAVNLKTLVSKPLVVIWVSNIHFSSPYVACQNGVVERKNRSLCEMARMMLDEHRTLRRYWAEAVNTSCHVGNRIFLRAFLNKTCYELMHRRAPRVSHFRAFGCRCFIRKKGRLDKFESRCSDGIFWGYASHS